MKAALYTLAFITSASNALADEWAIVDELNDHLSKPCSVLEAVEKAPELFAQDFVVQINAFLSGVQAGDNPSDRNFIDIPVACSQNPTMSILEAVMYAVENDIRTYRPSLNEMLDDAGN